MAEPALTDSNRARAVRRVIWVTLAMNAAVAIAKIGYGYSADALSIRADGFHSLTDSANNLVGLVGVTVASRPADPGHPYGHHKFEILAAGLVGLSLLVMAYDVAHSAFERLTGASTDLPVITPLAFVVLIGTLAVNIFVARYEWERGKALDSPFLQTDAVHTRSDVVVTAGVLLATICVRIGYPGLDLVAAMLVAAFIAWTGIDVLRSNLRYLLDTALVDPQKVEALALDVPGVASTHKIRTRGVPGRIYVDLHIQIAPHLDVVRAHRVTHAVIDAIKSGIPAVKDVLVHTEPARPGQPYKPFPGETETGA
jgi:cation diffusion facilitator family transporter